MSEEQLKILLEAVSANAELLDKLKAAGDADAVGAVAKAAGCQVPADELNRATTEVSEEELEGLAGGAVANDVWWVPCHSADGGC